MSSREVFWDQSSLLCIYDILELENTLVATFADDTITFTERNKIERSTNKV